MIAVGGGSKMPCESCGVQFSVFRRKRACSECERLYCAACLRRGGGMCAPCRALSTRPLARNLIAHLKVRDLQCFLQRQNVSTRGCVEKEELVSLCVGHVNSSAYRRRGSRTPTSGPFTTLKGLTNNFNDLINSAFDLRSNAQPQHPPPNTMHTGNCFNTAHAHPAVPPPTATPRHERFTTTPGGERDIEVPVPALGGRSASADSAAGAGGARRDTADCFEVEDVDDAGWEFVTRPADPLPGDSDVLLTANELNTTRCTESDDVENRDSTNEGSSEREPASRAADSLRPDAAAPRPVARAEAALRAGATPARAASELDLRRAPPSPGSTSLQDESLMDRDSETPQQVSLDQVREEAELEAMSVKQLKELLARNRVEFRGCLERADLLERARMLYRDHSKYKDEVDSLPLEECCKICMAAPLECVLLECGHIAACTACSKQLAECPICRQYVVRAVRFFRS